MDRPDIDLPRLSKDDLITEVMRLRRLCKELTDEWYKAAVVAERDALRQRVAELEQAGTWEPVEDGEYNAGKLRVHELAGRYVIATKATHDDTGQDYWNATSLPPDYRLCRRTTAQEQARPDA